MVQLHCFGHLVTLLNDVEHLAAKEPHIYCWRPKHNLYCVYLSDWLFKYPSVISAISFDPLTRPHCHRRRGTITPADPIVFWTALPQHGLCVCNRKVYKLVNILLCSIVARTNTFPRYLDLLARPWLQYCHNIKEKLPCKERFNISAVYNVYSVQGVKAWVSNHQTSSLLQCPAW